MWRCEDRKRQSVGEGGDVSAAPPAAAAAALWRTTGSHQFQETSVYFAKMLKTHSSR